MNEHGWNDPPPLPYKTLQSGQRRNHLNKRPGYPADAIQLPAHNLPPIRPPPLTGLTALPSAVSSTDPSVIANNEARVSENDATGPISLSHLTGCFERLLHDLETSGAMQRQTADEIRKRIGTFSAQWSDGSLSRAVQAELSALVQALEEHNYSKADSIQVSLMADHVTEVNQWLPGIKKIIITVQQKSS